MKHLLTIIAFSIIPLSVLGQIRYEGTHDEGYKSFQLDNGELKYAEYNKSGQIVTIYNLDHSKWKSVVLPLPREHYLDEIKSISQYVFNGDTMMELAYSCVEYHSTDNLEDVASGYVDLRFTLNIINELGETILKASDSNDMKIIESDGVRKLMIYKHIGQGSTKSGQVDVYSLPNKH